MRCNLDYQISVFRRGNWCDEEEGMELMQNATTYICMVPVLTG